MKKTLVAISLSLMMTAGYSGELSEVDEAKFNAAIKAYRMNQNTKALRLFTELYNDYPQNQQIKNNYAVVLFGNGKLEQAEEVLSSVIESDKEVNIAYKNLNKIYDYAAAKAYSNALGTEKEVTPQKLQIIEVLAPQQNLVVASAESKSSVKAPAAMENVVESKEPVTQDNAKLKVADKAPVNPMTPNIKEVANNVQVWSDSWSKADVNSYVVSALKDAAEPLDKNGVMPAVLSKSTPSTTTATTTTVALTQPVSAAKAAVSTAGVTANAKSDGEIAVVEAAVRNWAQAWSKGDVDSYVTFYEPTFKIGRMTHKQWLRTRKERVSPEAGIQVSLSNVVVTPSKTDDTIIANFKQSYQAKQYKDETMKQLVWKKVGDKWFIQKEANIN